MIETSQTTQTEQVKPEANSRGNFTAPVLLYSKDRLQNLKFRAQTIEHAKLDDKLAKALWVKCKYDIKFFFNVLMWTPDPRKDLKNLPFITWQYQDEYLDWLDQRYKNSEDGLVEKSRDMGASMLTLGWVLHKWLFEEGFNALLGSYIEDLVDNGTLDSHFGRLEYFVNRLPKFLLPKGFDMRSHRSSMKLFNPENNSMIVGYAPTERFSRAGRYSVIFADELAFWKHARTAWLAMGDATPCRITASTPNGKGNKFAELALKSNIAKIQLHWRLHPEKDQKWYDNECKRRTEEEIAQELDINYNKSVTGRVYPEFDEYNYLSKQEYDPLQPLFVSWDFGLSDETAIIWLQINPKTGQVRIIDSYQKSGEEIDYFVPFITGIITSKIKATYSEEELEIIERHQGWQPAMHFGDPTGNNKSQVKKTSVIKQLAEFGIYVQSSRKKEAFEIVERINTTKLLIRRLVVDKDQLDFIDAIENARFPKRVDTSQATSAIIHPIHDWTSHFRTALEFYAVNENLKKFAKGNIIQATIKKITQVDEKLQRFVDRLGDNRNQRNPRYKRHV